MELIPRIESYVEELVEVRRDLHANPELGFTETRTSELVAKKLESWGITVHRGIGGTGVVGELKGRVEGQRRIGLRADMDALPIPEATGLPWSSKAKGVSHACGHDGHMTMLLGAARYLAEVRDFAGTAIFVFQPAEEGLGGARAMLADRLFERFPCDEIYGLHNSPTRPFGTVAIRVGPAMAGADFFDIRIKGKGSHAARPQDGRDPVMAALSIGQGIQTITSRLIDPQTPLVVSITRIQAGTAYNVIPDEVLISGTVRAFSEDLRGQVRGWIERIAKGAAQMHGVEASVEMRDIFTVLDNSAERASDVVKVASEILGEQNVTMEAERLMGSEDFADMLRVVPGAFFLLGHGAGVPLHNPGFVFDDAIIPVGASILARLVETRTRSHAEPGAR